MELSFDYRLKSWTNNKLFKGRNNKNKSIENNIIKFMNEHYNDIPTMYPKIKIHKNRITTSSR